MAHQKLNIDSPSIVERSVRFGRALWQNTSAKIGIILLIPTILLVVFGPLFVPHDSTTTYATQYASPNTTFLLGTDHLGRDTLSRVLAGGRTSIFLGLSASLLAVSLGTPLGLVAGYYGGHVDEFLMRVMDILISIPTLVLALLIVLVLSPSLWNIIAVIGVIYAPRVGRVVRSSTLSAKENEYVLAATARGESDLYIMRSEILPNILSPIIIEGSIRAGYAILLGTSLSFLGLGTQPPTADWGFMIAVARDHYWISPWMLLWPALALSVTILGFNFLGDGLRDVLDAQIDNGGDL
jgi:peptide/nickel transport system permease protein